MTRQPDSTKLTSALFGATLILGVWPGVNWLSGRSSDESGSTTNTVSDTELVNLSENAEQCQLKFETQLIDFGEVLEGTENRFPLKLTNTSDRPIKVTSALASCGCTKVLTETPFVVPPHEVRELDFRMDTSRQKGALTKTVNVFVADQRTKFKLPVSVSAKVQPLISVSARHCDFGMLKPDQAETQQITITLHNTEDHQASKVNILKCPENVTAVVSKPSVTEQGEQQLTVAVSVDGKKIPEESISEDLILATPSTIDGVLRIPVVATQFSWVRSEPPRLDFGMVRESADATRTLQLRAVDQLSWTFESIELEDAPEYLSATKIEDKQVSINLDTAAASKGFFNGKLKVRYRCGEGRRQSIVIPISGYRFTDG